MTNPEKENLHSAPLGGEWFTSSYSAGSGSNCVELMAIDGGFAVRDSKFPQLTPQRYTHAEFTAFLANVKSGTFDTN